MCPSRLFFVGAVAYSMWTPLTSRCSTVPFPNGIDSDCEPRYGAAVDVDVPIALTPSAWMSDFCQPFDLDQVNWFDLTDQPSAWAFGFNAFELFV